MRTIQSMYIPVGQGHLGGGTKVHAEANPSNGEVSLNKVKYAILETISHSYKFNPAGYKTTVNYRVGRFELEISESGREYWVETSWIDCVNKREANKIYKASVGKVAK